VDRGARGAGMSDWGDLMEFEFVLSVFRGLLEALSVW
jgi:hypothetical protein